MYIVTAKCDFFTISKFVFAKICPPLPTLHKVPYLAPCPIHFLAGTLMKNRFVCFSLYLTVDNILVISWHIDMQVVEYGFTWSLTPSQWTSKVLLCAQTSTNMRPHILQSFWEIEPLCPEEGFTLATLRWLLWICVNIIHVHAYTFYKYTPIVWGIIAVSKQFSFEIPIYLWHLETITANWAEARAILKIQ